MSQAKREFERKLDQLFRRRTQAVRNLVGPIHTHARIQPLTGPQLRERLDDLIAVARTDLTRRLGRPRFQACVVERRSWRPKQGKPRGIDAKRQAFREWFQERIDAHRCVYVFWTGRRCEYVGRTGAGGSRPERHFEKFWFRPVTRIDCYSLTDKRQVAMAECLAIDMFAPIRNKVRASRPSGSSKCPVCSRAWRIRRELKKALRLR